MKKLFFLIIALLFTFTLSAQGSSSSTTAWRLVGVGKATREGKHVEEEVAEKVEEKVVPISEEKKELPVAVSESEEKNDEAEEAIEEDIAEDETPFKKKFRLKNRAFELGLADISLGFSNNFLTYDEIFTDVIIIDLEKLENGLKFDINAEIRPVHLFFNHKDRWGFGFDIGRITVFGDVDISGNLLRFKKTDGDKFGVGAEAFVDVGVPIFFHLKRLRDLKVNLRPAGYIPALYLEPKVKYVYKDTSKGSVVEMDYDFQLFTIVPLDPEQDMTQPEYSLGFDLSAGIEYPLFSWLDLGVDLINIPLVPGSLSHYVQMKGSALVDTSNLSFDGENESDDLMNSEMGDMVYGMEKKDIQRPFKTILYANYRPFKTQTFTIIPRIGFAMNSLYPEPISFEGGGYIRFDFGNMLITTFGVNCEDRLWKNSVDLAFNFRFFEFDIGASLQSPDFAKSWKGAGVGVNVGLKFGW